MRGVRAILYGLGNFFWSDVQDPLPHDLFQGNRALLASAWQDPAKATDYDLTAPLNRESFAHDFTFRSVIAVSRFEGNQLAELRLYPVEDGYGERLPLSGIPRLGRGFRRGRGDLQADHGCDGAFRTAAPEPRGGRQCGGLEAEAGRRALKPSAIRSRR